MQRAVAWLLRINSSQHPRRRSKPQCARCCVRSSTLLARGAGNLFVFVFAEGTQTCDAHCRRQLHQQCVVRHTLVDRLQRDRPNPVGSPALVRGGPHLGRPRPRPPRTAACERVQVAPKLRLQTLLLPHGVEQLEHLGGKVAQLRKPLQVAPRHERAVCLWRTGAVYVNSCASVAARCACESCCRCDGRGSRRQGSVMRTCPAARRLEADVCIPAGRPGLCELALELALCSLGCVYSPPSPY